jgi:hypothetical protein
MKITNMTLRQQIEKEIDRLSPSHQEEDVNLINNVLRPMMQYIEAHEKLLIEIARISGKHGV